MKVQGLCLFSLVACVCAHATDGVTGLATPKIDTHSHVYPDWYRQAVTDAGWIPGYVHVARCVCK